MSTTSIPTPIAEPAPRGQCWKCGYDLRGIRSRRCPECGWPFELDELLNSPQGIRLMTPTNGLARLAIPIAASGLLLDALLMPTSITLTILALLWWKVAKPYMKRSIQRQRILYRRFPKYMTPDPDIPFRKRIATVFLVTSLLVSSGAWQNVVIRANLIWLNPYAQRLFEKTPLMEVLPKPWSLRNLMPIKPIVAEPSGIVFRFGFGEIAYWTPGSNPPSYSYYYDDSYSDFSPVTDWWTIRRSRWNYIGQFLPFPALNR